MKNVLFAQGTGSEPALERVTKLMDQLRLTRDEKEGLKVAIRREIKRQCEVALEREKNEAVLQRNQRKPEPDDTFTLSDAYAREIRLGHSVGVWAQNGAAVGVVFSFVILLFCVLYRDGDLANKDIFNVLLGCLGTVVVQIFQYWFGFSSSQSGKGKPTPDSHEEHTKSAD